MTIRDAMPNSIELPGFKNGASPREFSERAISNALAYKKNRDGIIEAWNANAIDAALQRQAILAEYLEAFAIRLMVLDAFSVVHRNVPLEGTDKVEVPYFPLQSNASSSFVAGTGYTTARDWTQNSREVLVGGDGVAAHSGANAAANTACDRKFMMLQLSSYDVARNPFLVMAKLVAQAADKLALDVWSDIVSRVITAANFGAAALTQNPEMISADQVADAREAATAANWPNSGRSLVLDHTAYTPLLKDPSFKQYLSYGTTEPMQQGQIRNAYGFDSIWEVPNLKSYASGNCWGWINHKSAVLVATAPIVPTPEVRQLMSAFDVFTHPATGITLSYRAQGDATKDYSYRLVECAYGAAKGVDAALARFTT